MTVKRPGRRARREIRSRKVIAPRPPRRVHVSMLDDAGCEEMHVDVKEILWVIGFAVCDAATRRRLTLEHKRLEGEGDYPRIPPDLVERALSTVSPSVRLHRRDGTLALDIREAFPCFGPGVKCINILDHETGKHRSCTLADIRQTGKPILPMARRNIPWPAWARANISTPSGFPTGWRRDVRTLICPMSRRLRKLA